MKTQGWTRGDRELTHLAIPKIATQWFYRLDLGTIVTADLAL